MAGRPAVEQVAADTGMAERLAVARPGSVDKSVDTAADGLPLVIASKPVELAGTAAGTPAEVRIAVEFGAVVELGAGAALDTERPAGSGSCMEPADGGTSDLVGSTFVAAPPGNASESVERNAFLTSTSSSHHSASTDSRRRLPLRSHSPCRFRKGCTTEHNTKKHTGCNTNQVPTACIATDL